MNIQNFIIQSALQPADAIILNKKFFGMVDHYVIYIGFVGLQPQFVANYVEGVKVIPNKEIETLLQSYVPTDIEKFPGPPHKRGEAVKRALSKIGEKAYNYVLNNCEHFKNFVHFGIKKSLQVEKAGGWMIVGGIGLTALGAGKKNTNTALWGVLVIIIGLILVWLESGNSDQKENKLNARKPG